MKTKLLNLIDVNKSEIKYHIDHYPDGQIHLVLEDLNDNKFIMKILCRIKNSDDIFILMQLSDIANRRGLECKIYIPYLLTARTDRVFSWNEAFDLKIVTDIINSFNATSVTVLDPHSEVTEKLLSKRAESFLGMDINVITEGKILDHIKLFDDSTIIVAPDEGSYERLKDYGWYNNIMSCKKTRSGIGVINVEIDNNGIEVDDSRDLVVLDDLCDGGGTFIAIHPKLKELGAKSISLIVTHAIQESGIRKVASVYDKVIITNSYKDWENVDLPDNVIVMDVIDNSKWKNLR